MISLQSQFGCLLITDYLLKLVFYKLKQRLTTVNRSCDDTEY